MLEQKQKYCTRTSHAEVKRTVAYLCTYQGSSYTTIYQSDMYLKVRIDVCEKMTKKRKKHPPKGDDASTV